MTEDEVLHTALRALASHWYVPRGWSFRHSWKCRCGADLDSIWGSTGEAQRQHIAEVIAKEVCNG